MLNTKHAFALCAVAFAGAAFAQAKAPEPDYTLSYNAGVVTDYRYRGISQTAKKPALQGGVDYAHKNGFYAGAWGSTISWIKDSANPPATPDAKGPVEIDLYGGYKGSITEKLSYDVGVLQYWYAGNNLANVGKANGLVNANTTEVYGALSYGVFTAKYSQSLSPLFGAYVAATNQETKGSTYIDLSATFDLGNSFSLTPHFGEQRIKNFSSYTDYSLALAKDFDGLVISATYLGTNWKSKFGAAYNLTGSGSKDLAGPTLVLGIKKNF